MSAQSLHIGLNYVDPDAYDGWDGELAGCINDAQDFRRLASGLGLSPSVLTDAQATSHEVLRRLSQAARTLRSGDLFLVTYSGHGAQVNDATRDETDNLDETWVLWDRQVVDDELYALWGQFSPGVRIVVISDSCHSGTVAKMSLYSQLRNMSDESASRSISSERTRAMPRELSIALGERDRSMYDTVQYLAGCNARNSVVASLILISGCQDNQLSYDGDDNGLFTGTFLRVWNNGGFTGSYRDLHHAILAEMPPYQTPNFFTVGSADPAFEQQRPFTLASPTGAQPMNPENGTVPGPTPDTDAGSRPTLRVGDSGAAVRELQERLNELGHRLSADGFFGRMTRAAVMDFQAAQGQTSDGIVGPDTWRALLAHSGAGGGTPAPNEPVQPVPTPPSNGGAGQTPTERPTLRRGDRGEDVSQMQRLLQAQGFHVTPDGIFGPRTESLVKSFQRSRGLSADGVVGQATWSALERDRHHRLVVTRAAAANGHYQGVRH